MLPPEDDHDGAADPIPQLLEALARSAPPGHQVTSEDRLVEDLLLDSISMLELLLMVEDLIGHELSFEFVATWTTVGDVNSWLESVGP